MNTEKIKLLAEFIGSIDENRFNIKSWSSRYDYEDKYFHPSDVIDINYCDTAGCIAGWAIALENGGRATFDKILAPDTAKKNCEAGSKILGLTPEQGAKLFYMDEESVWANHFELYFDQLTPELKSAFMEDYAFYGDGPDEVDRFIDENSNVITNKVAAFMLNKIANGEVTL